LLGITQQSNSGIAYLVATVADLSKKAGVSGPTELKLPVFKAGMTEFKK